MPSVLFVDDDSTASLIFSRALESAGYEVELARNGEAGLERIREREFDVIITDVQMPGMDGCEMCEQMVREYPDRKPLVVVVTGRSELEVREWSLEPANLVVIHKPVRVARVLELIREHLGSSA